MTRNRPASQPTNAEIAILRVIWPLGEATVRQVYDALNQKKVTGYTTVLKLMQIMLGKGLLQRDESRRTHVYRPAVSAERTQRQMVGDLLDRVFEGSARQLVLQALSAKHVSTEELAAIRSLLNDFEQEQQPREGDE